MIEAVMYGMIPSPKIAMRVSAPPENRSMNERNPVLRLLRRARRSAVDVHHRDRDERAEPVDGDDETA